MKRNFAEPIAAAETIARYIGKLVLPLCSCLEERGLGARRLDLLLHRVDSAVQAVRVALARPVRDPKHVLRLLCEQIETIDPWFGVERMELVAVLAEPIGPRQAVSSLIEEPEADLSGLTDPLAHRLGGVPYPETFFYSNPGWSVLKTQTAGPMPRINASFSEPAACATFLSEVLFSSVWIVLQGYRVAQAKWLIPASALALACTTSTTGFITVAAGLCLLPLAALASGANRLLGNIIPP